MSKDQDMPFKAIKLTDEEIKNHTSSEPVTYGPFRIMGADPKDLQPIACNCDTNTKSIDISKWGSAWEK